MNKLVAYFSPTGTTAAAAKTLAEAAGAPLYEIRPAEPYTSADLNYMDKQSRSSIEMSDISSSSVSRSGGMSHRRSSTRSSKPMISAVRPSSCSPPPAAAASARRSTD